MLVQETIPQRLDTGRRAFVLSHGVLTSIATLMFSLSLPGQQAYGGMRCGALDERELLLLLHVSPGYQRRCELWWLPNTGAFSCRPTKYASSAGLRSLGVSYADPH